LSKSKIINEIILDYALFGIYSACWWCKGGFYWYASEMDKQVDYCYPKNSGNLHGWTNCVLVGQLNKFEIWNEKQWLAKENDWLNNNHDDGLEKLESLSFNTGDG